MMHPSVTQLLVIQDRDRQIAYLRLEKKQIPEEEISIDSGLKKNLTALEELKTKAKQIEVSRKSLEGDVKAKQDSILKFKNQMGLTKKNDEYQALNHEIERYEKDIVGIEDQELVLMEQYETINKQIAEEQKTVKEHEQLADTQKADLKSKATIVAEKLAKLEAERTELAAGVDSGALSKYERIMASKKDVTLVPLVNGHTCGGCHMKITPTTIHSAKSATTITQCENCGRILYFDE